MLEVDRLTVSELCGQLLVVGFEGEQVPNELLQQIEQRSLGGVILFSRNLPSLQHTFGICQTLHAATPESYPLLVGIDQEGGRVRRLKEGVLQLPSQRAFGILDELNVTEGLHALLAQELLSLGFTVNFTPVADVDSNPKNPIIGDRAFGRDPTLVTRHVRAAVKAYQEAGVIACIKHFPGHGDTESDSHLTLPSVNKTQVELRQTELYPFERAAPSALAVMTAHVLFPAFDRVPATLSSRLIETLLRREFAFEGIVFSDDLEMKALSLHWPIEETAVRAVEAGCDVLLICKEREQHERAHRALVKRAETDRDFEKRCRAAVSRALAIRQRYPQRPAQDFSEVSAMLDNTTIAQVQQRLKRLWELDSKTP